MKFVYTTENKALFLDVADIVKIQSTLDPGIYTVSLGPFNSWYLTKKENKYTVASPFGEKTVERINRVLNTFEKTKPLAVLFHGEKGTGKTLSAKIIANSLIEQNYAVIEISGDVPFAIIKTIYEKFDKIVVFFDEFEKNFVSGTSNEGDDLRIPNGDETTKQEKFLTLFDGICLKKDRLTLITINNLSNLSNYFLNRPSRIRYVFYYPPLDNAIITEYIKESGVDVSSHEINTLCSLRMNFDLLQAIVDEIKLGYSLPDIFEALGIDRTIYLRPYKLIDLNNENEHLDITGALVKTQVTELYSVPIRSFDFQVITENNNIYTKTSSSIPLEVFLYHSAGIDVFDYNGLNTTLLSLIKKEILKKIKENNETKTIDARAEFTQIKDSNYYFNLVAIPHLAIVCKDVTDEVYHMY